MKHHRHLLIAAALLLAPAVKAQTVTSAVPGQISYQGRVLNSSGGLVGASPNPVNRTVVFRVWAAQGSTLVADLLYSESQTVTVSDGEFSVLVGNGVANSVQTFGYSETAKGPPTVSLASVFNGQNRFLGVTVAAGATLLTTDNEITPRQQIVTSAYAFRAKFAENLGSNGTTAISAVDSGNIGVGNTNPPALFTVTGANTSVGSNTPQLVITDNGDQNERLLFGVDSTGNSTGFIQATKVGTGATNLLLNPNGGNIGIGLTGSPTAKLDVAGAVKATGAGGYTFNTNDLDGGLFSPADGVITLQTNGSERVRVDATGNVGIGTTAPAARLELSSATAAGERLRISGNDDVGTGNLTSGISFLLQRNLGNRADLFIGHSAGITRNATNTGLRIVPGGDPTSPQTNGVTSVDAVSTNGSTIKDLALNGDSIRIQGGGNVGIGTPTPSQKLEVVGNVMIPSTNRVYFKSDALHGIGYFSALDGPQVFGWAGGGLHVVATGTTVLHWDVNNNVSIGNGTANATKAKLQVEGAISNRPTSGQYSQMNNTTTLFQQSAGAGGQDVSIYGSHTIWAGVSVCSSSDVRIKDVKGVSSSAADLAALRQIQVTDYLYKDRLAHGGAPQKKVIAQQVEKVYPQAVSRRTDLVPDIFKPATMKDGWVQLATGLKKGDRVKLLDDKTTDIFEVLEVAEGKFRTAFKPEGDKLFVYGREVKDFRTVDYDAISMLNVSATQELARKVETLEKANAEKDTALTSMTKRLAEMEAKEKALDAKLAAIEKLLLSSDKPAVRTVSLKAQGAE